MTDPNPSFQQTDFNDPLPPEGYHEGVVDRARFRTSERGNMTLQVIYELPDAQAGYDTALLPHSGHWQLVSINTSRTSAKP
jgi:hypothetical protein